MKPEMYWQKYIEENNLSKDLKYSSYYFCDNEKDAKELGKLVIAGKKRATSSNALCYEIEPETWQPSKHPRK